ncbi:MAG TPA: MFS transporter, partial [bacterium]|nr:MFS transporter [bacterium]
RVHYGWIIVAALSVTETISWGIIYYGFPVFLQAMEHEFKASAVSVAGAFSVALAITALAAVPVGRWMDRAGPRGLMTVGSCLAAALTIAWAHTTSLGMLYAVWCGMGFAMAMTLYDPAFAAIVQWFGRHRDRALLTVTLVAGLASTIFMPLAAWLLARVGWRGAVEILGVILAVVTIPIHALVLRPSSLTHAPNGAASGATGSPSTGVTLRDALRTSIFWALNAAFAVGAFATVTITVHLIPFLTQRGYPQAYAAAAVGWIGAMQIPGRLLFVPVAAWLGRRAVTGSVFVAQAVAMAMLPFVGQLPALIPAILLLGAANGMSTLARPSAVADAFGRRHYASVSGAIAVGSNGARALAPIGAALLGSWMGSYGSLFWMLSAALAAAGIVLFLTETRTVEAAVPGSAPRGTRGSPD